MLSDMRNHSSARPSTTSAHLTRPATTPPPQPPPKPVPFGKAPEDGGGFMSLLLQAITWEDLEGLSQHRHPAGRCPHRLSRGQLLAALLFHFTVSWTGNLAEHVLWLLGIQMAPSSLSQRRQAIPFEVFKELMRRLLRPLPQPQRAGCYRGLSLTAIDGVCFSLPNTAQVEKHCRKGANQNGKAAFAKLHCAALIELVMHNPLGACIGLHGESEWKLALGLLDCLPQKCLLLGDRLYGCAAFLVAAMQRVGPRQGHVLVRVKQSLKVLRRIKRLADGSQVVEIGALEPGHTHRLAATLQVREIRARVQRAGFKTVQVRLWTTLLDCRQAPAHELVELYMSRWEQELYFRELKQELGINDLLRSQTVETAAQEVAAMIIGSSLIAHERSKLKPHQELSHRISFRKIWETLEPLWLTLLLGADILSQKQKQQLCDRFYWIASRRMMPRKRTRSCPRAMRQPILPWPRKRNQKGSTAPLTISLPTPLDE